MTIQEAISLARQKLRKSQSPRLDAELAAGMALGCSRSYLLIHPEQEVSEAERQKLEGLVARLSQGEPVAYVLGSKEFFGYDFRVTRDTLIPRPDTETLVETALETMEKREVLFADLGAGSGCVGISLCLERPGWKGFLLEKEAPACKVAALNAAALGAANAKVLQGDLFSLPFAPASLDCVVSNPPYIAMDDPSVMDQVRAFEPHRALFSGDGGLSHLKAAAAQSARVLKPGGVLAFEHGCTQGPAVRKILLEAGFFEIKTKKDLSGLDRVSTGVYTGRRCC